MSDAGMTTIPLEDEFGDVIGKARRGLGLEPADVARRADLDEATLESMEDCERQPTQVESERLAAALELHAPSLWDVATEAWRPQAQAPTLAGGLQVRMIPHPPMRVTMYIVGDPVTGDALVVDPGALPETVLDIVREAGWRVTAYLITHGDADHIDALAAVYAQAVRLDEALSWLPRLDLVKMDIEGHELIAFDGCRTLIERHRPTLVIEFSPTCMINHGEQNPEALLDRILALYPAVRATSEHGDDASFDKATDLMAYWDRRNRELTQTGLMPEDALHFDLIVERGRPRPPA
jgi:hypothetical protein